MRRGKFFLIPHPSSLIPWKPARRARDQLAGRQPHPRLQAERVADCFHCPSRQQFAFLQRARAQIGEKLLLGARQRLHPWRHLVQQAADSLGERAAARPLVGNEDRPGAMPPRVPPALPGTHPQRLRLG